MLCFNITYHFSYVPCRHCDLLGSGSLWHLPHLWFEGHILYRVAGSTAGDPPQISHRASAHSHVCRVTITNVWLVILQGGFSSGLSPRPVQVLCGHDQEVTCVAISTELDMAVSGSKVSSELLMICSKCATKDIICN